MISYTNHECDVIIYIWSLSSKLHNIGKGLTVILYDKQGWQYTVRKGKRLYDVENGLNSRDSTIQSKNIPHKQKHDATNLLQKGNGIYSHGS